MWHSIQVGAGAAIKFRNCVIRDSEFGIAFSGAYNWAVTEVVANDFLENYISIYATLSPALNFSAFTNNVFRGGLFPLALAPYAGQRPFGGVVTFGCVGTIGTSGTAVNDFRRMRYGLYAAFSTLSVNNCLFRLMSGTAPFEGSGVYSDFSSLTFANLFGGPGCTFSSNELAGLTSNHTNGLFVSDALFDLQPRGIQVVNSTQVAMIEINDNEFVLDNSNSISAVNFERPASTGATITRNYITNNVITIPNINGVKDGDMRVIDVRSPLGPATDNMVIANNYITNDFDLDNTDIDGIFIQNASDGFQVAGNILSYTGSASIPDIGDGVVSIGIGVSGVTGIRNIVGPNNSTTTANLFAPVTPNSLFRQSYIRCAFHFEGSPDFRICKNLADNTYQGYHFSGNCGGVTDFGMNHLRNHYNSLHLCTGGGCSAASIFPAQPYRENLWEATSGFQISPATWGASSFGITPFTVDGTQTFHVPNPPADINPLIWFAITGNHKESTSCDSLLAPVTPRSGEREKDFMMGLMDIDEPAGRWDYQRYILEKFRRFPALLDNDQEAQEYYNANLATSAWAFANAEELLREAYQSDENQLSQLDAALAEGKILVDSLVKLEYMEGLDTTSLETNLTAARSAVMALLDQNRQQIQQLQEINRSEILANLESVYSAVSQLPAVADFESNRKTVLLYTVNRAMELN